MAELIERHFMVGYTYSDKGIRRFGNYRLIVPAGGRLQAGRNIIDMIKMDKKLKFEEFDILSICELSIEDAKHIYAE